MPDGSRYKPRRLRDAPAAVAARAAEGLDEVRNQAKMDSVVSGPSSATVPFRS